MSLVRTETTDPLVEQIEMILSRAESFGLSKENPVVIIRRDNWASFYVGYGSPDPADVSHLPSNLIRVEANPEDRNYGKGFARHPTVPTMWFPLRTVTQLAARQNNIYDQLALNPLSKDGGKMKGKLIPRSIDPSTEVYDDDEVVPLSVIRSMISGGGGGSADHELRLQVVEQHLTELDDKITNLDPTFTHRQNEEELNWIVKHNFGSYPAIVQCCDINGNIMMPESIARNPKDPNILAIKWSEPTKGFANLIR